MPTFLRSERRTPLLRKRPRGKSPGKQPAVRSGWATLAIQLISATLTTTVFGTVTLFIRPLLLPEFQPQFSHLPAGVENASPIHGLELVDNGRALFVVNFRSAVGIVPRRVPLDRWRAEPELNFGDASQVPITAARMSPSGERLLIARRDGSLSAFRTLDLQQPVWTLPGESDGHWITEIILSPDGSKLATLRSDLLVEIRESRAGAKERRIALPSGFNATDVFRFSRDGESLITTDHTKMVAMHRVRDGKLILHRNFRDRLSNIARGKSPGNHQSGRARFAKTPGTFDSPTGSTPGAGEFVTFGEESVVGVVDLSRGEIVYSVKSRDVRLMRGYLSADSKWLAVTQVQGGIEIHDLDARRLVGVIPGNGSPACKVVFAPGNSTLLAGSYRGEILEWDLKNFQLMRRLTTSRSSALR